MITRRSGKLQRKLELYGRVHLSEKVFTEGLVDAKKVLLHLHFDEMWSVTALARSFGVHKSAIYQMMETFDIKPRNSGISKFQLKLKDRGYEDPVKFFVDNSDKTYEEMGELLGVTARTVARQYALALKTVGALEDE